MAVAFMAVATSSAATRGSTIVLHSPVRRLNQARKQRQARVNICLFFIIVVNLPGVFNGSRVPLLKFNYLLEKRAIISKILAIISNEYGDNELLM